LYLSGRMFHINESLKAKLDQINDTVEQMSFEEHIELKHTVFEHIMWIEDCWKCLHCLYPLFVCTMFYIAVKTQS
jgi:hypothetical protein